MTGKKRNRDDSSSSGTSSGNEDKKRNESKGKTKNFLFIFRRSWIRFRICFAATPHLLDAAESPVFVFAVGMTVEQRDKLKSQQGQYKDAKVKLEDQLLKLKEEREKLKEDGNKHEDKIMRENAKLQVSFTCFTRTRHLPVSICRSGVLALY